MAGGNNLLFLEKAFLRPPPEPLRGVELFNLELIEEMIAAGWSLTIPAHAAWRPHFEARAPMRAARCVFFRSRGVWVLWRWRRMLSGERYRALFLANVGNGLIPLLHLLKWSAAADRLVLLAHRTATPRFLRALRAWPSWIVAVNRVIARQFRDAGYRRVAVDYGVMKAERYFPANRPARDRIRFVVLGALDIAWKGADTAIAAFQRLPPDLRTRCELHLASYVQPPQIGVDGVIAHAWKPDESIPAFLREMDVMICPSRDEHIMRETFSQAIVKGMLTGLPIVASDLPIYREKLDAGGGLLFADVGNLAEKMARMASDPAARAEMGAAGRATALARYCWDTRQFLKRYVEAPLES